MDTQTLNNLFEAFAKKRLLLIGDLMLDAYVWGKVDRISPEAPVPVLDVTKKEVRPGGLANVALNLRELDAQVAICAVVGNDVSGNNLIQQLSDYGIDCSGIVVSNDRITTVKTRVISNHKHVIRIDEEQTDDIGETIANEIISHVDTALKAGKIDGIIFEDYNKGVLTQNLIEQVVALALRYNIPTCVDPKKKNFFAYKNVTLFKPNLKELTEGLKLTETPVSKTALKNADDQLRAVLQHKISLITLSERGVFVSTENDLHVLPAHIRNIADVSGAGDTVIAVAALCLICGSTPYEIAFLSNLAGGIVCEHVGVVPILKDQLYDEAIKLI